jgi:hypothetical protein
VEIRLALSAKPAVTTPLISTWLWLSSCVALPDFVKALVMALSGLDTYRIIRLRSTCYRDMKSRL